MKTFEAVSFLLFRIAIGLLFMFSSISIMLFLVPPITVPIGCIIYAICFIVWCFFSSCFEKYEKNSYVVIILIIIANYTLIYFYDREELFRFFL